MGGGRSISARLPRRAPARLIAAFVGALLSCTQPACTGDDNAIATGGGDASAGVIAPSGDAATPDAPLRHATAPAIKLASQTLDFGALACGTKSAARPFTIANAGSAPLHVSLSTMGPAFSANPGALTVAPGDAATVTITASMSASNAAGATLQGGLLLFSDDSAQSSIVVPISATPSGATIALAAGDSSSLRFPPVEVGATVVRSVTLTNTGNAPATLMVGAPSDDRFRSDPGNDAGGVTLAPGATLPLTIAFTPKDTTAASATVPLSTADPTCGVSLTRVDLSGQAAVGQLSGWPTAPIDFGAADCGGSSPAPQSVTLQNSGPVDARITRVQWSGSAGFKSSAAVGRVIAANGGVLTLSVSAPPVPSPSPLTAISATLTVETDADSTPHVITLVERPRGAVLRFDTSQAPGFGSFGNVVLLNSQTASFRVANDGNAPASVQLSADGASSAFTVAMPTLAVPAGATQDDAVRFAPVAAGSASASLTMRTADAICAALPAPIAMSGAGVGGGPHVEPTSLTFQARCGGGAPPARTVVIANQGNASLTWSLGAITGPGASQYSVATSPAPGLLIPGASATITVSALAVPSPAASSIPSAYDAELRVTTDVPLDPPHVIALGEVPLGDRIAISVDTLRFGQVPIGTRVGQSFSVSNAANPGSPDATITLAVAGAGAGAYAIDQGGAAHLPAGAAASERVAFAPTLASDAPATLTLASSDPLCDPLPAPLRLSGTGTQGKVALSATTLAFGSDPSDARGLVACGATGRAQTLTVTNVGNQPYQVTALSLAAGARSPFTLSGAGAALPATVPIGGAVSIVIAPRAIPSAVTDPNDPAAFSDTLTVTTDAALDAPHPVSLVMQPRGAVIADTPLPTDWSFGTIGAGSRATFTTALRNLGNSAVTVTLDGLAQPTIFGLATSPTVGLPRQVTSIVGQFTPVDANGSYRDRATLVVLPTEALCAPLPTSWQRPTISLSGASNGTPPITVAGALSFPTTECGGAPPAAQSISLSNATNVPIRYAARLSAGAYYTIVDAGPGTLPPNGAVSVLVAPKSVTPGAGVVPGAAPYADDLLVTAETTPPTSLTVPVSWTLSGAVLALPSGAGPLRDAQGSAYYPADGSGSFTLPIENTGSATASVSFALQPVSALTIAPAGAISIIPGGRVAPELVSTAGSVACPSATPVKVSFFYSGPICQPIALSSVTVHSCAGAL